MLGDNAKAFGTSRYEAICWCTHTLRSRHSFLAYTTLHRTRVRRMYTLQAPACIIIYSCVHEKQVYIPGSNRHCRNTCGREHKKRVYNKKRVHPGSDLHCTQKTPATARTKTASTQARITRAKGSFGQGVRRNAWQDRGPQGPAAAHGAKACRTRQDSPRQGGTYDPLYLSGGGGIIYCIVASVVSLILYCSFSTKFRAARALLTKAYGPQTN